MAEEVIGEIVPGALVVADAFPSEGALRLAPEHLVEAAVSLRDDDRLRFTVPLFCTAIDWLEREPRFDVVYMVRSMFLGQAVRFKVSVSDAAGGRPSVPSLSGVWRGMGWHEREVYDLFGIGFDGHPDLRRLLMPADWEGHPLRKDYVSFGEPVKFSDRGSFPPDSAVPSGSKP